MTGFLGSTSALATLVALTMTIVEAGVAAQVGGWLVAVVLSAAFWFSVSRMEAHS